jgi:hypothetical protein
MYAYLNREIFQRGSEKSYISNMLIQQIAGRIRAEEM